MEPAAKSSSSFDISSSSLCNDFVFNKPTKTLFDARTFAYCIPFIRSIIRIATAITTYNQNKEAPLDNLQKKRVIIDVTKWAFTSILVDIIPLSFIPFLGTIAGVAGLFALIATVFEIKPIVEFLTPNPLANGILIYSAEPKKV